MKRILLSAIAFLALLSPAFATSSTATFGDKNSSGVYRITADNSGVVTYASDTGLIMPYSTSTTSLTLTAAQTGTTLVVNATSNSTKITLPTATVGMSYDVVAGTAKWLQLTPQSTDTIQYASLTIGQGLANSATAAAGDSIEVFCAAANTWSIKNVTGTWSHTNATP